MLRLLEMAEMSGRYVVQWVCSNYLHIYLFCLPTRITVIYRLDGKTGGVALIAKSDRATCLAGAIEFGKHGFTCEQAPDTHREDSSFGPITLIMPEDNNDWQKMRRSSETRKSKG
jgi:hypothetical protein